MVGFRRSRGVPDALPRATRGSLARALGLQGRFEEAGAVLDGVSHPHPLARSRVALEQGRLRNSAGNPAAAIPYLRDALAHADAAGSDALAIDVLHMLAIADTDRADDWTRQGLARAGASSDPRARRWRGALHNTLG